MTIPEHPYRPLIETVCAETEPVPANVLEAMVWVESNFDPSAKSLSNALGLGQIIYKWHAVNTDRVAEELGKKPGELALYDPAVNLRVAARHLRWCYSECGSWENAVAKYHSGQCNPPPDFTDGQGTTTYRHVAKFRAALEEVNAYRKEGTVATKPYFLISAGHRSTNDPGNPVEKDLTDDLSLADVQAFRSAGYTADWYQRDLDKDSNPTQTIGDLATMVNGYRRIIPARPEEVVVVYENHFNGAESAFHIIVADRGTLSSAYADGNISEDNPQNNTLDLAFAARLAEEFKREFPQIRLYSGKLGVPGVMSEQESGVGLDGDRLGVFGGTAIYRDKAVRVIIEHGGTKDFTRYPNFAARCALVKVRAAAAIFGQAPVPTPQPAPVRKGVTLQALPVRGNWRDESTTLDVLLPMGTEFEVVEENVGRKDGSDWMNVRFQVNPPGPGTGFIPFTSSSMNVRLLD